MFINYSDYKSIGGTASETDFIQLEFQARTDINYVTLKRLASYDVSKDEEIESLKWCMFFLIEDGQKSLMSKRNTAKYGAKVSSISNDGYSIAFKDDSAENAAINSGGKISNERLSIIYKYLPEYCYAGIAVI